MSGRALRCGALLTLPLLSALAPDAGAIELKPSARLHLDYASHDADRRPLPDAFLVRRASVGLEGKLGDDWEFELGYDFANGGSTKDVVFKYEGWSEADLRFGQYKVPFGLEELGSSNGTVMIERAMAGDAFGLSRRMGVGLERQRERYGVALMAFGNDVDGDDRGRGAALRATLAPIRQGETVLHLGAAFAVERPRGEVKISARPESRASDVKFVNTGGLADVDRIDRLGLEAAWKSGPLLLQGEWMQATLHRDAGLPDARFDGWYLMGSRVLAGTSRPYRNGTFKSVPADAGGAWELSARYGRVNLDDGIVRGGREANLSVGLTYYVNRHLRIMGNYIRVQSERRGVADDPDILLMRAQVAF